MNDRKKILIYAHYYYPDVASTGQILQDLAEEMIDEFDVTIICAVPSYTGKISAQYKYKKIYNEKINGVNIVRVAVPEFSKTNKISRLRNLLKYFINACMATKHVGEQDYVLAISQPPIIGGVLGLYGKNHIRCSNGDEPKFIYCIQDFNPEQIEATAYIRLKFVLKLAKFLDMKTCRQANLIITVGRDLISTLKQRFANEKMPMPAYKMINNWIDEKQIYPLPANDEGVIEFKRKYGLINKFVIMYSGNIGLYYDLEGIIKVLGDYMTSSANDNREVIFAFVGEGSVLGKLKEYKAENNLNNIVFIPYQEKEKLIYSLNAADVHWCVNAMGIKGVSCPSKFYGIIGVGKPVIGVLEQGSEIEMLIKEIGCGICAEPGDYAAIRRNIKWFIDNAGSDKLHDMGKRGYDYMLNNLTKTMSVHKYMDAIREL